MRPYNLLVILFMLLLSHPSIGQDQETVIERPPSPSENAASENAASEDSPTETGAAVKDETPSSAVESSVTTPSEANPPSTRDVPTGTASRPEPLASRVRAVRAIRFGIVVFSILLSMTTIVVLMQVNRWSHGRYAGRLWWLGILLFPGWLLVGVVWAWNNDLWHAWLDGNLL